MGGYWLGYCHYVKCPFCGNVWQINCVHDECPFCHKRVYAEKSAFCMVCEKVGVKIRERTMACETCYQRFEKKEEQDVKRQWRYDDEIARDEEQEEQERELP